MYLHTESLCTSVISLPAIRLAQINVLSHMAHCSETRVIPIHRRISAWNPSLIQATCQARECIHGAVVQTHISSFLRLSGQKIYLRLSFLSPFFKSAWQHPQNSPEQPLVNGTYRNVSALIFVSISKIKLATPLGPASVCLVIISEARASYFCYSVVGTKKKTHYREITETPAKMFQELPTALLSFALCNIQPSVVLCMQTLTIVT